ncbi:hypothetical protein Tco_0529724 [Tanacetum coccineum]
MQKDSPDDEEDTRSSHEYLNDLEEEYQARALLAKSKRFFKTSFPSYQSPFQSKLLLSSENKLEPRQIKDFEAKYHKVKAKLALFSSSASAPSSSSCKNNGLIAETYDWDDEEVSSNENEVMEIKALMALTDEERVSVGKESARNGDWTKISMKKKKILGMDQLTEDTFSFESKEIVFVKSSADNSDMPITNNNIHKSSETKDSTLPNQDTDEVPLNESQRNTTNPLVVFSDSSATDYDPADESLVCSTPFLPLKKLNGVKHVSEPKTIKSILKSKSTFKAENLKGITINELSSAPAKGKSSSASKTNSVPAGKLKNVKMEDDPPLAIVMKELNELKLQISKKKSSYSRKKMINGIIMVKVNLPQDLDLQDLQYLFLPVYTIISLRRGINPRNPQHVTKNCKMCGSNVHTTSNQNDIECFRKRETLQAKNDESFKASKNESSSSLRSKTPTKRFNLEDIILNTNNEVALLYLEHNNKGCFKCVSDFISKCCLIKPFTRSLDMYKEYLDEFWYSATALENSKVSFSIPTSGIFREVGVNTFRNAIGAHYLAHSSEYVAPPSIDIVRQWFPMTGYKEEVSTKGTLKKSLLPPRWRFLIAQIIWCLGGKTEGFDQITNKDAIILYSLANGINIDYANIFWEDIIIKLKKKQRKKVVPYTRFLSLLIMHKMKEGYGDDEVTLYPHLSLQCQQLGTEAQPT